MLCWWDGHGTAVRGNRMAAGPRKITNRVAARFSNSTSELHPKEGQAGLKRMSAHADIHGSAAHSSPTVEAPLSSDGQTSEMRHVHATKHRQPWKEGNPDTCYNADKP